MAEAYFPCKREGCPAYVDTNSVISCSSDGSGVVLPNSTGQIPCRDPLMAYGDTEEVREYLDQPRGCGLAASFDSDEEKEHFVDQVSRSHGSFTDDGSLRSMRGLAEKKNS